MNMNRPSRYSRQPSRSPKHPLDKHLYAQCHLVECCFSKLKKFLRVATRYEKTARKYLAIATIADNCQHCRES
jgi:putative transposase